jgi:GT2 family glycosyltransferase
MSITFIVITRNRLEKLTRCLNSITKHVPEAQIIVVDNGSKDGTEKIPDSHNICFIHLKNNLGFAGSRNAAIEYARKNYNSEYLFLLDDDALIDLLSLEEIRKTFSEKQGCGIIAPLVLYPDGRTQESIRSFPTITAILWRGLCLYKIAQPNFYKKYIDPIREPYKPVDWALGAALIIKRNVFEKIGLFNTNLFYHEDSEFCRRALRNHFVTIYNPNIKIRHDYMRTSAKLFHISTWRHVRSLVRFFLT